MQECFFQRVLRAILVSAPLAFVHRELGLPPYGTLAGLG